MKHKLGYSWGTDCSINLMRSSKGWLAVFYHQDGKKEIIKIFKPKHLFDYYKMIEQVTKWNYGTCELCPMVKVELDWG